MTKRMLIDATHPEETRVVVLDGNRLEEFDVETSTKQTLKGNIYLARVVRVEPSLQAAFVEFGGNRHGFLAFGEIHPDYYQIPVADRQRLLALAEEEAAEDEEDEEDEDAPSIAAQAAADEPAVAAGAPAEAEAFPTTPLDIPPLDIPPFDAPEPPRAEALPDLPPLPPAEDGTEATPTTKPPTAQPARMDADTVSADPDTLPPPADAALDGEVADNAHDEVPARTATEIGEVVAEPVAPETIGGGEQGEEDRPRRINPRFLRNYKIQEVIKRRQILLVQVVKEERGTKGAALTTYLSLAGRYSVLMPNTPRGGGISRKISSATDRKRLREVMTELALPKGMGIIVRTAGAARPKAEIKRDCEYLLRLWDSIRETTLASVAPSLIYEEANLIKRAIRDVYSRDVDEVLVDGEDAYRTTKDFMRMLIPSHAKKVQLYRDGGVPLFARAGVEAQLDAMHNARVELRSGGSIVINQTEALVAIDVNSGRATRERNIEETALKTNCEAADEIARQLRLRDLAGLIVIDFIDMETARNNAAVERRLKEALKNDRARIQVGRISHFGLMEMSRQRLRPSLTETAFITCPHCAGTGLVRSTESAAVQVLRAIEDEAAKRRAGEIVVRCAGAVALYLLNMKRYRLIELETAFAMRILFAADDTLLPPALKIERTKPPSLVAAPMAAPASLPPPMPVEEDDEEDIPDLEDEDEEEAAAPPQRAVRGERQPRPEARQEARQEARSETRSESRPEGAAKAEGPESEGDRRRRRRRRRRGGRREDGVAPAPGSNPAGIGDQPDLTTDSALPGDAAPVMTPTAAPTATPIAAEQGDEQGDDGAPSSKGAAETEEEAGARRRRGRRGGRRRRREEEPAAAASPEVTPVAAPVPRPLFQGATPANPFGDDASFDLFDALEQDLAATVPQPPAEPQPPLPQAIDEAPQAMVEPRAVAAPPEPAAPVPAAPEPPPVPAAVAEAPAPEAPAPEPGPIASMEIKPVVVDEPASDAPKKRGWWRR
ncbi:ribonuclease E/G [Elioraea sp.]|uniref:ribonuclease E/G n=1 Tax=Elioraea sp. TaxID=2185103 RepID=UPI0025C4FCB6|nr:ribonuclease E/G [Elioraea sp.]